MEATLIYNAKAGNAAHLSPEQLVGALSGIGYRPVYRATECQESLKKALSEVSGTVFVAGGDGSVRAVAAELLGRDVQLGILPMGTANNIGRSLGIAGEPLDLIERYRDASPRPFDVGRVSAPWGEDLFLEGFGCGLFAEVLATYDPEDGKSPLRAAQALISTLGSYRPQAGRVEVDGQALGGLFAVLEVLNTCAVGPRLAFAPTADPGDGQLDVVQVDGEQPDPALQYAAALVQGTFLELASVTHRRAQVVEFEWQGQHFHVDGEVRPPPGTPAHLSSGRVRAEVWPGALTVLRPSALPPEEA